MKILMVCLGNICRSPMAEGILRKKAESKGVKIMVDSAGTGPWHVGQHPDGRAVLTAKQFGVDISKLVGRQFLEKDFEAFDRIYVMDSTNYADVLVLAKNEQHKKKVNYLLAGTVDFGTEVPDPYFGGPEGFIKVFEMIDKACDLILDELMKSVAVK